MADTDTAPAEAPARSPSSRWRRGGIVTCLLVVGAAALAHVFGGAAALVIGVGAAVLFGLAAVVRHLPTLRHHLNDGRRPPRPRGQRGGRFRRVPRGARPPRRSRSGAGRHSGPKAGRRGGGIRRALSGGRASRGGRAGSGRAGAGRHAGAGRRAGLGRPGAARAFRTGTPARSRAGTRASSARGTGRGTGRRRAAGAGGAGRAIRRGGAAGRKSGSGRASGLRGGIGRRSGAGRRTGAGRTGTGRAGSGRPGSARGGRAGAGRPNRPGRIARLRAFRNRRGAGSQGSGRRRTAPGGRGGRTRPGTYQGSRGGRRSGLPGRGQRMRRRWGPFGIFRTSRPMPPPRRKRSAYGTYSAARPKRSFRHPRTWFAHAKTGGVPAGVRHPRMYAMGRRFRRFRGKAASARAFFRPGGAGTGMRRRALRLGLMAPLFPVWLGLRAHRKMRARGWFTRKPRSSQARRWHQRAAGKLRSLLSRLRMKDTGQPAPQAARTTTYTIRDPKAPQRPRPAAAGTPRPPQAPGTPGVPPRPARPAPMAGGNMASPLAPVTEDVKTGFDKFQPETAQDMIQFFGEFPEFFEALASSLGGLAGRMESEMPLDPGLAETMREFAGTIAGLRDQASEMNRQFRQVHAKEIERIEEPRPGEQAWDVGAQ